MVDTQVPITINQQSGVDFEFSTAEKFLDLDDFQTRYLEPYMIGLSNTLDSRAITTAVQNTANFVGTVGSTPGLSGTDAFLIYSQASQKLDEMGFPLDLKKFRKTRNLVVNSAARTGWNTFTKQFYNPADSLTKQWKTGQIDNALAMDWMVDQNVPGQVIGTLGGTGTVTTAGQTGTSILTTGWTASVNGLLNIGDVVTFTGAVGTGVYAVNPQSRVSTGSLQDFVIQATINSDGSGNATLVIEPSITPSGQFQNVTNSPAANCNISVYHVAAAGQSTLSGVTTPQGLLWTNQAHAFVSFPGDVPEGVDMAYEARSKDIGVSIRFVRIYDGARDMWINRTDVYYGTGPLYPEGAVRIALG
jgi:hypothetical protein